MVPRLLEARALRLRLLRSVFRQERLVSSRLVSSRLIAPGPGPATAGARVAPAPRRPRLTHTTDGYHAGLGALDLDAPILVLVLARAFEPSVTRASPWASRLRLFGRATCGLHAPHPSMDEMAGEGSQGTCIYPRLSTCSRLRPATNIAWSQRVGPNHSTCRQSAVRIGRIQHQTRRACTCTIHRVRRPYTWGIHRYSGGTISQRNRCSVLFFLCWISPATRDGRLLATSQQPMGRWGLCVPRLQDAGRWTLDARRSSLVIFFCFFTVVLFVIVFLISLSLAPSPSPPPSPSPSPSPSHLHSTSASARARRPDTHASHQRQGATLLILHPTWVARLVRPRFTSLLLAPRTLSH